MCKLRLHTLYLFAMGLKKYINMIFSTKDVGKNSVGTKKSSVVCNSDPKLVVTMAKSEKDREEKKEIPSPVNIDVKSKGESSETAEELSVVAGCGIEESLHVSEDHSDESESVKENKESRKDRDRDAVESICINVEKKPEKGEDADPIAGRQGDIYYVGAFDGMGGSGAAEYTTKNGTHTGAYIASRRVQRVCDEFLKSAESYDLEIEKLKTSIMDSLNGCMSEYGIKPSGLRGAILRILPTTLAMVTAQKQNEVTSVKSYWCGDSRNYIFTSKGLLQVSNDHLTKKQDPLENLRNDESLSNCVCQDKSFFIESYNCGQFTEPIIILSASDGCFGYLKSPMHFEYLLLDSLQNSDSMEDWKFFIEESLRPISGDDFSLGLLLVDGDFMYWKKTSAMRYEELKCKYIDPISFMEGAIQEAKNSVNIATETLYNGVTDLWVDYKQTFLSNTKEDEK